MNFILGLECRNYYLFCLLNDNSSDYFYLVGIIVSLTRRVGVFVLV